MPEGPFGLSRMTDYGPFVEVDIDRTDITIVEEEKMRATPVDAAKIADLPRRANYVKIEAKYDTRGMSDKDQQMIQDIFGVGDFIFKRQAGYGTYYYWEDRAFSTKTEVDEQFREVGLGSELMLQKLEGMRTRGIREVWSIGATRAGRSLLEKHGFRLVDENDNIYTKILV